MKSTSTPRARSRKTGSPKISARISWSRRSAQFGIVSDHRPDGTRRAPLSAAPDFSGLAEHFHYGGRFSVRRQGADRGDAWRPGLHRRRGGRGFLSGRLEGVPTRSSAPAADVTLLENMLLLIVQTPSADHRKSTRQEEVTRLTTALNKRRDSTPKENALAVINVAGDIQAPRQEQNRRGRQGPGSMFMKNTNYVTGPRNWV
jgi:hypothetical protein